MALRAKIRPDEAESEDCGGSTVEDDNKVWPDLRRNPKGGGAVSGDGGVDEDGLGVVLLQHRRFGWEEEAVGEVGDGPRISGAGGVGLRDADEGDLRVGGRVLKKLRTWSWTRPDEGIRTWGCAV